MYGACEVFFVWLTEMAAKNVFEIFISIKCQSILNGWTTSQRLIPINNEFPFRNK